MRSPHDPLTALVALGRVRAQLSPAPEAERRLRLVFPEVWARYERLAAERAMLTLGRPAARSR